MYTSPFNGRSALNKSTQHRMIVVRHRPLLTWIIRGSLLALALIATISAYLLGHKVGAERKATLESALAESQASLPLLETQTADLTQQLMNARMGAEVDRKANEAIRKELLTLRATLQKTQQENAFFKNIMNPKQGKKGPDIDQWERTAGSNPHEYRFKVIAKQLVQHTNWVQGHVKIHIVGQQNGQSITLDYADISSDKETDLKVKYRYFQTLTGSFTLPADFVPETVMISLIYQKSKNKSVTKQFSW